MKKARTYIEKVNVDYDVADNRYGYEYESFPIWYKQCIWKNRSREHYNSYWIKQHLFINMVLNIKSINDSNFPEFADFANFATFENNKWETVVKENKNAREHNAIDNTKNSVWKVGVFIFADYRIWHRFHVVRPHIQNINHEGITIVGPEKDWYSNKFYSITKIKWDCFGENEYELIGTTKLWETV
jgi:hypothetical protein